jgi:nitroimidazol reductase NimA-like FMN-containing flavoprotein (pyridoxamine 5'-phosphate oxidase superfamily)
MGDNQYSMPPESPLNVPPSDRATVRRLPKRGIYERAQIEAILDEGLICHAGFVADGQPYVIPTAYVRSGDQIYIHGSAGSRMLRTLASGVEVCVTVTLLDGLVLARSAFHHSMNYRSVVILGKARLVADPAEKWEALRLFTNHVALNRWEEVRQPNEKEMKATSVLVLSLTEASAKVRQGPPIDDEEDYAWPVWAGVAPVRPEIGLLEPDDRLLGGVMEINPDRFSCFRAGRK